MTAHIYACRCELSFHSYYNGYSRTYKLRMAIRLTLFLYENQIIK